jgi:acyl-CoA thioesterase FadM
MVLTLACRQLLQLALGIIRKPVYINKHIVSEFRAYPLDLDMFMHMNNTAYPRVGELASWNLLAAVGFLKTIQTHGFLALVITEQHVIYKRQILPFQKYEIHTRIIPIENKWLEYTHVFKQHRNDVSPGESPIEYAVITKKALVKNLQGKTVKVEEYEQFLKKIE